MSDTKSKKISLGSSINWAPRDVPLVRRTQTLAVLSFVTMHLMCLAVSLALLFNPFTVIPFLLYLGWALFIDDAPKKNGRPIRWFRDLKWFKLFRDYFPISLENSKALDPSRTYIFGYHPHGIISLGAFCNFATNANDVIGRFPGINISLLTLSVQFNFPIARDILLALNLGDVSKESCLHKLNSGPGSAIMIVVGGAAESLDAHPGNYDLALAKRKGFVKLALQTGSSLLPVLSFGETDVYDQMANAPGTKLREWQEWFQHKLGFALPFIHGRGIFNYDFGLLPHRKEILTVVGDPIDVPKLTDITEQDVNKYHELYLKGLQAIWDAHPDNHTRGEKLTFH